MSKNTDHTIAKILRLMQTDDSIDAPPEAIRWSKNIFRTRAAEPKPGLLERISAVLQMDLSPNQAAFGERSAAVSPIRQMLFQAGANALDFRIVKNGRNFDLTGQVLGEDFAGCSVKINEFEATANERSEFKLAQIPGGVYDLILQGDMREIVVSLDLK